jgi:predicted transcriptional regulator
VKSRKLTDRKLLALVDQGLSQVEIAKLHGVSKQAINKRLLELRGKITKVVAVKKIEAVVDQRLDTLGQLNSINKHANWLLEHLMAWAKGDEAALQVLENQVKTVRIGDEEQPVKEVRMKDPRALAVQVMAEIRGQLALQVEIFKTLFDMRAVEEFQAEVLQAIQEASPDVRAKIIRNLNQRRALSTAVSFR